MPQFIPILLLGLQSGLTFGGALGVAFSVYAPTLLQIGLSIGLSFAASLFAPKPPRPEDVQSNLRQATPPRHALYGEALLGGPWVFGGSKNGNFHKVIALSARKLSSIENYWVDDNIVTRDGSGNVTSEPYFSGDSKLRIESRLGLATETYYSNLEAAFPEWDSTHRGDGVATLYARQKAVKSNLVSKIFPNLKDTLYRVHAKGVAVYDPTDEAQDIEDDSTWTYSDNLARCVMDYLWHADGMRVPVSLLTTPLALAGWQAAVNDCNDLIAKKAGGTEKRYRCWNVYQYNERPADVLRRMMAAGAARLVPTPDGGLTMEVAKWRTPTVTIDETMILGFEGVGRGKDILQTANTVFATFTSPDHQYQTTDADPWVDDDDVGERGEISFDMQLPCSPSHGQTRRLMKLAAYRAKPEWVGTFFLNRKGLICFAEGVINFQYAPFGIDGTFEITDFAFNLGEGGAVLGCRITVQSLPEEALTWNATDEEGTAPPFDNIDEGDDVPLVTGFTAELVNKSTSGVSLPYARLEWDAPADGLTVEVFGKLTTDSAWTKIPIDPDETTVDWFLAEDGGEYEFEAGHVTLSGTEGDRVDSTPSTLTAIANPNAPLAFDSFGVTGGLGHATFAIDTKIDANLHHANVYMVPAGVTLDKTTHTKIVVPTVQNSAWNHVYGDNTRTNIVTNGDFAAATGWTTGTGWSIGSGVSTGTAGTNSGLSRTVSDMGTSVYRGAVTVVTLTAGLFYAYLTGGSGNPQTSNFTTTGRKRFSITAQNNTTVALRKDASGAGTLDDYVLYLTSGSEAAQGLWDFYPFPANSSDVEGTGATPVLNVEIV